MKAILILQNDGLDTVETQPLLILCASNLSEDTLETLGDAFERCIRADEASKKSILLEKD